MTNATRRNASAQKAPSSTTSMYTEEEKQGAGVRHPPVHLHAWEEVLALKPGSSFSLQTRSVCLHQDVRSVHVSIHGNKTELPLAVPDARMWHHVKRRARLITEACLTYYIQFKLTDLCLWAVRIFTFNKYSNLSNMILWHKQDFFITRLQISYSSVWILCFCANTWRSLPVTPWTLTRFSFSTIINME